MLQRLEGVSDEGIGKAVTKVEGLTADEEENNKRHLRTSSRKALVDIRIGALWFLFYVLCGVGIIITGGFLLLIGFWVNSFYSDPVKLGNFIQGSFWSILLVMATLFAESVFRGRDD